MTDDSFVHWEVPPQQVDYPELYVILYQVDERIKYINLFFPSVEAGLLWSKKAGLKDVLVVDYDEFTQYKNMVKNGFSAEQEFWNSKVPRPVNRTIYEIDENDPFEGYQQQISTIIDERPRRTVSVYRQQSTGNFRPETINPNFVFGRKKK